MNSWIYDCGDEADWNSNQSVIVVHSYNFFFCDFSSNSFCQLSQFRFIHALTVRSWLFDDLLNRVSYLQTKLALWCLGRAAKSVTVVMLWCSGLTSLRSDWKEQKSATQWNSHHMYGGYKLSEEEHQNEDTNSVEPRFKGFLGTDYFCLLNPKSLKLNLSFY